MVKKFTKRRRVAKQNMMNKKPDPDTLYSADQVPAHVQDPLGQVKAHALNVVRRRISRRAASLRPRPVAVSAGVKSNLQVCYFIKMISRGFC